MYFIKPEITAYADANYGVFKLSKLNKAEDIGKQIEKEMQPSKSTVRIISFTGEGSAEEFSKALAECIEFNGKNPCRAILEGNDEIKSTDIVCVDKSLKIKEKVLGHGPVRIVFEILPASDFQKYEVKATYDELTVKVWGKPRKVCDIANKIKKRYTPFTNRWMGLHMLSVALNKNNINVVTLNMPNGAKNCLKRANISTIAELTGCTADDLKYCRTIGDKTVQKIETALAEKGLALRHE